MKKGSPAEKAITAAEEKAVAAAVVARKQGKIVVERQAASDRQLAVALDLLVKVRVVVIANKQTNVQQHVDEAIKQIQLALKVG
jgi:hypothetical protein